MHVFYCYDENCREMAARSKASVKKHNPNAVFHDITKDDRNFLSDFGKSLCGYRHVSTACFLRFLIPVLFPNLDRALYLDCDTVCKGSLDYLENVDLGSYAFGACKSHDVQYRQARELGLEFYINSGVLLYNVKQMNAGNYLQQIAERWRGAIGRPQTFSADETILNWVFQGRILALPERFNYCYNRRYKGREVKPKDVVIWHVTGADKRALYEL